MITSEEKKSLVYSLGAHCFIVLLLFVRPYFSSELKPFKNTIRVDIVAMPKKHQKIFKKKEKITKKQVERKKKIRTVEKNIPKNNTEAKQRKSLEKDAFAKLVRMQEEKNKEAQRQENVAGNRVSKGIDLKGVEKVEYSNYTATLHGAISAQWNIPKWLLEGDLSAIAHIKIDERGSLIFQKIIKSSGNLIYDEKVRSAIMDAAPFSPPPEKFKKIVYYEGVELLFPR